VRGKYSGRATRAAADEAADRAYRDWATLCWPLFTNRHVPTWTPLDGDFDLSKCMTCGRIIERVWNDDDPQFLVTGHPRLGKSIFDPVSSWVVARYVIQEHP
jgi:hypothetical protein